MDDPEQPKRLPGKCSFRRRKIGKSGGSADEKRLEFLYQEVAAVQEARKITKKLGKKIAQLLADGLDGTHRKHVTNVQVIFKLSCFVSPNYLLDQYCSARMILTILSM